MILNFRHRGLKRFYEKGERSRINSQAADTVEEILTLLDIAEQPGDMDLPGYRLHPLKGDLKGVWAVDVTRNWRITFRFEGKDVCDVNFEDYH
jgi:toxin HigB-1